MDQRLNAAQIVNAVLTHILERSGSPNRDWYIGITSNPNQRLIREHHVNPDLNLSEVWPAVNTSEARYAEKYLIDNYGFQGGPGGGDDTCIWVYAYLTSDWTNP